jgi:hypothetical protein
MRSKAGVWKEPVTVTKKNILKYLIAAGKVLDEQNVPKTPRYLRYRGKTYKM